MVNHALTAGLAAWLTAGLFGCTAEFGGRCANADECDEDRTCIQGYCLPPDSPDGDGGPQTDGDPQADGGQTDGGQADSGPVIDGVIIGERCVPGSAPAYDRTLRPCPDESTAALWRFDDSFEATTPPDGQAITLDGSPNGDRVQLDASGGAAGGAAIFDGAGDPQLRARQSIRTTGPLTVELWARLAGQDDQSRTVLGNLRLSDAGPGRAGGFEITVDQSDGDSTAYNLGLIWAAGGNRQQYETSGTFPAERWTHLAAVIEADGAVRLSIDGIGEDFAPIPFGGGGRAFIFGRRTESDDRYYPGALDEVRISTVARDPETLRRVAEGFTRPE